MDSKRIRFGFVCSNEKIVSSDMLPALAVKSMECALLDGRQFVVFTVDKSIKVGDVMDAMKEYNSNAEEQLKLETFDGCDSIITFEKGPRYLHHPFYAVIHEAKNSVGVEPQRFWEWTADGVSDTKKCKRVVSELVSELVDESITPSAEKRERTASKSRIEEGASKKYKASFQHKMKSGLARTQSVSSFDVNIFSLVNEMTKSKDETIAAKNYTIQLMETMLQKQLPST